MKERIVVSVLCITYNHISYIRETLEGFLMQKTDYPIEVLIHDDASTDGTDIVLKEYEKKFPSFFTVLYEKENQWNKGIDYNHDLLAPLAKGEYIALCEGDDAWIDEDKIQIQVDYMEKHKECSLVTHKSFLQYPSHWNKKRDPRSMGYSESCIVKREELYFSWKLATSTFLFRKSDYIDMPSFILHAPTGDEPLKFYLSELGTVYYINRVMSVYNRMATGSWSERNGFDSPYNKTLNYTKGYVDFFMKFDEFTDYKNSDFYHKCIRERIQRALIYILLHSDMENGAQQMVEELSNVCNSKWEKYILSKKKCFSFQNNKKYSALFAHPSKNTKTSNYIYGAGDLTEAFISNHSHDNLNIKKIITTKEIDRKELSGIPIISFDDFMKEWKSNKEINIFISVSSTYAKEIMIKLNENGINSYYWLYEDVFYY